MSRRIAEEHLHGPLCAIDLLALLLMGRAYLMLIELRHPHEPIIATL